MLKQCFECETKFKADIRQHKRKYCLECSRRLKNSKATHKSEAYQHWVKVYGKEKADKFWWEREHPETRFEIGQETLRKILKYKPRDNTLEYNWSKWD